MPITVITLGEPVRGSSIEVQNGISSTFSAANIGTGAGIFKTIVSGVAQFKSLVASTGIQITSNTNDLTLNVDAAYITSLVNIGPVGYTLNRAIVSNGTNGALIVSVTTAAELAFVSGVTSSIQTQLNGKQATVTGAASTVVSLNLANNFALASDGSGKIVVSIVTATELSRLSGVTSSVQGQLNSLFATVGSTITNPLTADLIVPNPYKISFNSGAIIYDLNGITMFGSSYISLASGFINTNSTVYAGSGFTTGDGAIKHKIIQIGSWQMNSTGAVLVGHGLNYANILALFAVIYDDTTAVSLSGGVSVPLNKIDSATGLCEGGIDIYDNGSIILNRRTGGFFQSASYSSSGVNRGYLTVWYKP